MVLNKNVVHCLHQAAWQELNKHQADGNRTCTSLYCYCHSLKKQVGLLFKKKQECSFKFSQVYVEKSFIQSYFEKVRNLTASLLVNKSAFQRCPFQSQKGCANDHILLVSQLFRNYSYTTTEHKVIYDMKRLSNAI